MKEIKWEEIKQIQLRLLDEVARFCDENGISYWLDAGTMLGAVRHKGYIPWDDDIDLGMLRPDYERFIRSFRPSDQSISVQCIETDKKFCYPYAKILDHRTVLYEPDLSGKKSCVNIDLFVYDNAPDNENTIKRMFRRRDRLHLLEQTRYNSFTPSGNILRRLGVCCFRMLLKFLPKNYFAKALLRNATRFADQETKCIGSFLNYSNLICDKAAVDRRIEQAFEGKTYKIPVGYDRWLRSAYGNYMEMPPKEQRKTHHQYIAFIKEENDE